MIPAECRRHNENKLKQTQWNKAGELQADASAKIVLTKGPTPKEITHYHETLAHAVGAGQLSNAKAKQNIKHQKKALWEQCSKQRKLRGVMGNANNMCVHCDSVGPWRIYHPSHLHNSWFKDPQGVGLTEGINQRQNKCWEVNWEARDSWELMPKETSFSVPREHGLKECTCNGTSDVWKSAAKGPWLWTDLTRLSKCPWTEQLDPERLQRQRESPIRNAQQHSQISR